MIIYKGFYITNTGDWGGCHSYDVCYAKTEDGARKFTIKTVEDKYKENLEWKSESKKFAQLYGGEQDLSVCVEEIKVMDI
jgi:hypothetical protein